MMVPSKKHDVVVPILQQCVGHLHFEGYKSLVDQANYLPWPKSPKFIFTSNNYDTDEIFKVWTAQMVSLGVPYLVGQHGCGYGTHLYFQNEYNPECSESDYFFTWGWSNKNSKNVPAFIFKNLSIKNLSKKSFADVVLVAPDLFYQNTHWDTYHEFSINQQHQFDFIDALPKSIQDSVLVRLHQHDASGGTWSARQRWHDRFPEIKVDSGNEPFKNLLQKNYFFVFAFDSTGMLECMAMNYPVIAFWDPSGNNLNAEAKEHYQCLVDVGIVHHSPGSAALFLSDNLIDIKSWWDSELVQDARRVFCLRFAKTVKHPAKTLKKLLAKNLS